MVSLSITYLRTVITYYIDTYYKVFLVDTHLQGVTEIYRFKKLYCISIAG